MPKMSSSSRGFTLIELIVVIAIISILASVVSPSAFKAIEKSKIARLTIDIKNIKTASMSYYADVGLWPPDVCPQEDPGFVTPLAYQSRGCGQNYNPPDSYIPPEPQLGTIIQNNWDGPYLEKRPPYTPWGGSYDWEYWPGGGWGQVPGTYVSVRPRWKTPQLGQGPSAQLPNSEETDIPNNFEVKLQQQGIDLHCYNAGGGDDCCETNPARINDSTNTTICRIMRFDQ